MANLVLLAVCLLAGALLRASGKVPPDGYKPLNAFVIYIALPALVLAHVHGLRLDPSLLYPALMPWLVFGVGVLLLFLLRRAGVISRPAFGALSLTAALGNTSFVGLPMIEAFYGKDLLAVGVTADQLGTFMCLNLPGIVLAARLASRASASPHAPASPPAGVRPSPRWSAIARQVLLFPPFLSLLVALLLRPVAYPEWVTALLARLGDTLSPVALVSVGLQLRFGRLRAVRRELALGLGYKLLLAPALALLVFAGLLGARGPVLQVTVFEAAMAPMITGSIVAQEHGLEPELAALMVGVGIPLSFLTLAGWWWVLGSF